MDEAVSIWESAGRMPLAAAVGKLSRHLGCWCTCKTRSTTRKSPGAKKGPGGTADASSEWARESSRARGGRLRDEHEASKSPEHSKSRRPKSCKEAGEGQWTSDTGHGTLVHDQATETEDVEWDSRQKSCGQVH